MTALARFPANHFLRAPVERFLYSVSRVCDAVPSSATLEHLSHGWYRDVVIVRVAILFLVYHVLLTLHIFWFSTTLNFCSLAPTPRYGFQTKRISLDTDGSMPDRLAATCSNSRFPHLST